MVADRFAFALHLSARASA
jgi:hypothetical protein